MQQNKNSIDIELEKIRNEFKIKQDRAWELTQILCACSASTNTRRQGRNSADGSLITRLPEYGSSIKDCGE